MKRVDQIRTICNLGCGTMGFSTAVVFAGAGYEVRMFGRRTASIERAMMNIKAALAGLTDNGLLSQAEAVSAASPRLKKLRQAPILSSSR